MTLRGATVATDFKHIVIDYIERRYGAGGGRTAAESFQLASILDFLESSLWRECHSTVSLNGVTQRLTNRDIGMTLNMLAQMPTFDFM
jgi:hypothetical protein